MSAVITNPIQNIPVNPKSHVHGWTQVWKNKLDATINHKCSHDVLNADTVFIDHGANFGGTLNLFGGVTKDVFDRIELVASCDDIVSLDWDMPDYGAMLKTRIGNKSTYEGVTEEWCDKISKRLSNVKSLKMENLDARSVTIGDSHTIAFSASGDSVYRNDGKTLFGALKSGLVNLKRGVGDIESCTLSLGSIDIRHHLLRRDLNLDELIREYVKQGDDIARNVLYSFPVPVEYEDRKIPKTGYYKGTPFFGSMMERKQVTKQFKELLMKHSNGRVVAPPEEWYHMDPKKYADTYMETGSSVHIAPPYHRRNDWGISGLSFLEM